MPCTREDHFRLRLQQILRQLGQQYPSLVFRADFWRYAPVNASEDTYADELQQVWIRLEDQVLAFVFEKNERFYHVDLGIINQRTKYMIVPEGMNLVAGDHVVFHGASYLITEQAAQAGVEKLKIEEQKSSFVRPGRGVPVYRQLGIKAVIA